MYIKRYQWLDDSEIAMATNLAPWLMSTAIHNTVDTEQAA